MTPTSEFADGYLARLTDLLARIDRDSIACLVRVMLDARSRDASIFLMGNGGSAASASHWANDLARWRSQPVRAVSLVDNAAMVTAMANDVGFDQIFRMQLEGVLREGGVVMAISASGN